MQLKTLPPIGFIGLAMLAQVGIGMSARADPVTVDSAVLEQLQKVIGQQQELLGQQSRQLSDQAQTIQSLSTRVDQLEKDAARTQAIATEAPSARG